MVNGAFNFSSAARDLAFQCADPRVEFGDRQAIEILAQQRGQRIVGPGPKDIVQVHIDNVDRCKCEVNKARRRIAGRLRAMGVAAR